MLRRNGRGQGRSGNRYSLGRLTIGGTDFSTTVYNYNGAPPHDSTPDYDQSLFSVAHDMKAIIPLARQAQDRVSAAYGDGTQLRFISSSWSPPAWMKRPYHLAGQHYHDQKSGLTEIHLRFAMPGQLLMTQCRYLALQPHMRNSAKPGMKDDPRVYQSYALYLSKYASAYQAAGVNISMMTIQNEPDSADHMFPVAYPACNFNGTGEGDFLRDYLGPRMARDHPNISIYVHDGQKFHDVPILDRVRAIVAAAGQVAASQYIHGVAFHWCGPS
jgi:glucosylceramidase